MKQEARPARSRKITRVIVAAAVVCVAGLLVCVFFWRRGSAFAYEQTGAVLRVESSSFLDGGPVRSRLTCDGAGDSPDLHWANPPAGTQSLAIVMHDPDTVIDFTHWLAYNIPASVRELPEDASTRGMMPQGSAEGNNSFDRTGYGGPCPPGGKPHHYIFQVYALNAQLNLPPGASRRQLESAMNGHVLAEGRIVGVYQRVGR